MSGANSDSMASDDQHASEPVGATPTSPAGSLVNRFRRWLTRSEPMARPRRLIIGLGNPGPKYAQTRHNVGFMVADAVAARVGAAFSPGRGPFLVAEGAWKGSTVGVAKTATLYMNQSGTGVQKLLARYGLTAQDILVVYDDLALDLGQIRLRASGGAGGHNGVQDVIDTLGSANFPRLRMGIGSSFPRGRQVEYVLGPFSEDQRPLVDDAIERAVDASLAFVAEGLNTAMNRFNKR